MVATDADDGENGRVSYKWRGKLNFYIRMKSYQNINFFFFSFEFQDSSTSEVFQLNAETGYVVLASSLDRAKNSSYDVIIAYFY